LPGRFAHPSVTPDIVQAVQCFLVRRLLAESSVDRRIAQMNHLFSYYAAVAVPVDAKKQRNSSATLSHHDAATLLVHQSRRAKLTITRPAQTFEYHLVTVKMKIGVSAREQRTRRQCERVPDERTGAARSGRPSENPTATSRAPTISGSEFFSRAESPAAVSKRHEDKESSNLRAGLEKYNRVSAAAKRSTRP
jgi:hypothetical protein